MKQLRTSIADVWTNVCIKVAAVGQTSANLLGFLLGLALLSGGLLQLSLAQINPPEPAQHNFAKGAPGAVPNILIGAQQTFTNPAIGAQAAVNEAPEVNDVPYDDTLQRNSVGNLFKFIEGAFGALVMTAAGIGAIVAASMGAYKAAVGILVVAIGAFILRAFVSLFFGTDYVSYDAGAVGDL